MAAAGNARSGRCRVSDRAAGTLRRSERGPSGPARRAESGVWRLTECIRHLLVP
jgi:hypothetical protein